MLDYNKDLNDLIKNIDKFPHLMEKLVDEARTVVYYDGDPSGYSIQYDAIFSGLSYILSDSIFEFYNLYKEKSDLSISTFYFERNATDDWKANLEYLKKLEHMDMIDKNFINSIFMVIDFSDLVNSFTAEELIEYQKHFPSLSNYRMTDIVKKYGYKFFSMVDYTIVKWKHDIKRYSEKHNTIEFLKLNIFNVNEMYSMFNQKSALRRVLPILKGKMTKSAMCRLINNISEIDLIDNSLESIDEFKQLLYNGFFWSDQKYIGSIKCNFEISDDEMVELISSNYVALSSIRLLEGVTISDDVIEKLLNRYPDWYDMFDVKLTKTQVINVLKFNPYRYKDLSEKYDITDGMIEKALKSKRGVELLTMLPKKLITDKVKMITFDKLLNEYKNVIKDEY